MKKILEQVKNKDFDIVRVILLSKSFAFNLDIQAFRKITDNKEKEQALLGLIYQYRLPRRFILNYAKTRSLNIEALETDLCVNEVFDPTSESESGIDQEGVYIKFDPEKTDRFYKRVIKKLRSSYEFHRATGKAQRRFVVEGGKSPYLFNAKRKASQKRHQHGLNFDQDMKIYLTCEKTFKQIDSTLGDSRKLESEDITAFIKNALAFAAEKLNMPPQKVKEVYYEVCNRYQLPTLTKNPPLLLPFVKS